MSKPSDFQQDISVQINGTEYFVATTPDFAKTVRRHAVALDRSARIIASQFEDLPKDYLLLLAAINAFEELALARLAEEERTADNHDSVEEFVRRIIHLTTLIQH